MSLEFSLYIRNKKDPNKNDNKVCLFYLSSTYAYKFINILNDTGDESIFTDENLKSVSAVLASYLVELKSYGDEYDRRITVYKDLIKRAKTAEVTTRILNLIDDAIEAKADNQEDIDICNEVIGKFKSAEDILELNNYEGDFELTYCIG
jgi:hypothetical protein